MKNRLFIRTLFFFLSISFFSCNQINGQSNEDELGIKNEKDFVNFIKSNINNQNIRSENSSYKKYQAIIKNTTQVFTVNIEFEIDKSGNNLHRYFGDIYVQNLTEYRTNGPLGFRKSYFNFRTYNDIILGSIVYFTGPPPYSSGANIVQQYLDIKKANQIYKSIPNVYIASYQFEIQKDESKDESTSNEIVDDVKVDLSEMDDETRKEYEKNKKQKTYEDSLELAEQNEKERFLTFGGSDNAYPIFSSDNFKILSKPKLVYMNYLWEGNGRKEFRNHGYTLLLNPKKQNDTLSFKSYNPTRNGKIIQYTIINGKKIETEKGFYKNGKTVGEYIKYNYDESGNLKFDNITYSDNEGNKIKFIQYWNEKLPHPFEQNKDTTINYILRIINFNPKSGLWNGQFEEFQIVPYYKSNDFNISKNPILKISGTYQEGKKVGIWKEFYDNKQLKSMTNYSTGESETYDEKGVLINKIYKKSN